MCKKMIMNENHNSLDDRFMNTTEHNWIEARKAIKYHFRASHSFIQKVCHTVIPTF